MIDEDWLRGLRFRTPEGLEVDGLAGLGAHNVVFSGRMPDGRGLALKLRRHHLGFQIRELPLFLNGRSRHDRVAGQRLAQPQFLAATSRRAVEPQGGRISAAGRRTVHRRLEAGRQSPLSRASSLRHRRQ